MESLQKQRSLSAVEGQRECSAGVCDLSRDTQISDSGLDSLVDKITPTESLISQDTLDYIFQGFDSPGRKDLTDLTPESETQSIISEKNTLSGSTSSLRDTSKNLFQRLGTLYSDKEFLSSPIHRTEEKFYEDMNDQTPSTHSTIRLEKLSALANSISNWEDELPSQVAQDVARRDGQVINVTPKKYPAPQPPQTTSGRILMEDEKDFIRKPSVKKTRAPDIPKLPPRGVQPGEKKENLPMALKSPLKGMKDPAEMSLKERLALFERNRVNAPTSKGAGGPLTKPPVPKKPSNISSGGIRDKIATLFSTDIEKADHRRQKDVDTINCQSESVLRPLLPPPAPPTVPSPGKRKSGELENIEMVAIVEEPKRPKTIQMVHPVALQVTHLETARQNRSTEANQGYPRRAISYDEDSSIAKSEDASFSEDDQMEKAEKSITQSVLKSLFDRASAFGENQSDGSASDLSGHLEDVTECLDESLPISSDEESRDKGSISSDSFLYRRTPVKPTISVIREEDSRDSSDEGSHLLHSVSFYRKQQGQSQSKCHKVIISQFNDSDNINSGSNDEKVMEEKIKKLNQEIHKQQQIISQTSQALNLCAATVEFSGSSESVEGERHLLVATHRRLAALNELQRINVEKSLRPRDSPPETGSLIVTGVTLPLAQSYIRQMATETIPGHHLVCLLKYNDTVLATQTIVTLPGLVAMKFSDELHLPEVYADFKVTLEVYGMVAQREVLPHELKYHILGKKVPSGGKKFITPVKRLRKPIVESPAGPSAVRSPAFVLYGFVIFSLRESQRRTAWVLNRSTMTPDPLEGVVHMRVKCQLRNSVEHRGFLTMFDDVSGLGAWHRRWCHLQGTTLNYWKYPDDEMKKTPIGTIDLQLCKSSNIGAVPRDVCARLNTILLELERPSLERDKESLVLIRRGENTLVRHLLSTDTRDEREEWCRKLNHVIKLIKCWGYPE